MASNELQDCPPSVLEELARNKARNKELLLELCLSEIDNQKYERVVEYFRRLNDESAIETIIERAYQGRIFRLIKLIGYFKSYEMRLTAAERMFAKMTIEQDLGSPYILYFYYRYKMIINQNDFKGIDKKLKAKFQDLNIKLIIALRVIFINWAGMIRATNYQHILNYAKENVETGLSVEHFLKDLISEAYAEHKLSDVENILNFIGSLHSTGHHFVGYQTMFDQMYSQHDEREIFMLAYRICEAMKVPDLPSERKAAYEEMKARLPPSVRMIIWHKIVYLKNTFHNEYLYSPAANFSFNTDRLHVFTWGPGKKDSDCRWSFETDDKGRTFHIKCLHWEEYFYAADHSHKFDDKQRRVFTWRSRDKLSVPNFRWFVAANRGSKEVSLQNAHYGEFLYASTVWYNKNRRHVFTCEQKVRRADGFWLVEEA